MKLVLCSSGFFTPEIVAKTVELVGKPQSEISVAVINEAYVPTFRSHSWVAKELSRIDQHFGGRFELVNLLALDGETIKERLQQHDIIYVLGGPTDYEMYTLQKSGFTNMLPELLEAKVYVGSSAGSMILGKRIPTEVHTQIFGRETDKVETYGVTKYLGIVDMAIKPHMGSPKFPNCTPENLKRLAPQIDGPIYGIADDTAIIIDGDQVSIVGDNYIRI